MFLIFVNTYFLCIISQPTKIVKDLIFYKVKRKNGTNTYFIYYALQIRTNLINISPRHHTGCTVHPIISS